MDDSQDICPKFINTAEYVKNRIQQISDLLEVKKKKKFFLFLY